ncbi:MAG: citramalate synthase [Acidobacteriota bacterium]|nr:citramalate synthase [Blastocatellia bacterium]MDW8167954.1 citramalate synthase [Acidobacteriota bacterium]MDW8255979.1 citramalate synthase [Acidobacteriota bacterium]
MRKIELYDTTLRDGTQGEDVCFSVEDKMMIARKLDELGIDYIEGGWPGSNPRDAAFFKRARHLRLRQARLVAFGSTCHPRHRAEEDPNLRALLEAETPTVTIFGKSWDRHVIKALGTTLERNLELIRDSVAYLKAAGREVIYDAEHFFDGFRADPEYALATLVTAERAGADVIVLCDTNGGTLTHHLVEMIDAVRPHLHVRLGIHTHNDSDLAVANAIAAVERGITHVQGTINGYGERCGNANLCSIIPILELKMGYRTIGPERLVHLTSVSHFVSELANLPPRPNQPFVGRSAFAHKAGVHVSAVLKDASTYEHIPPEVVGNARRVLVSDLSGKSNLLYKATEMGIDLGANPDRIRALLERLKMLEHEGYQFEGAEGSLRLLLEEAVRGDCTFFQLETFRVVSERTGDGRLRSVATVQVRVGEHVEEAIAQGKGPVLALDRALRKALRAFFPSVNDLRLTDYKVRVLDARRGTAAKVRVLVQTSDGEEEWRTVGVSENILEASYQALVDAVRYKLLKEYGRPQQPPSRADALPDYEQQYGWGV